MSKKPQLFIVGIFAVVFAAAFIFAVLQKGTPADGAYGILQGQAKVGPICPVEREGEPCFISPETYTSREIIVYAKNGKTVVARRHFDAEGYYRFELPAGEYVADIARTGIDSSKDLPQTVVIRPEGVVILNIDIDTGIR